MPQVNVLKRVKTPEGWRFCPVPVAANGRLKTAVAMWKGAEVHAPDALFYIEFRQGGKRIRESVGTDAAQAVARQKRKQAELTASEAGIDFVPDAESRKVNLKAAVTQYLHETRLTKKPKTVSAYTTALEYFQESCHKLWVEEIDRTDMLEYAAFLRDDKEQSPRSCRNKFENVMTFLKSQGRTKVVQKGDWPRYVEEEPEAYEKEELDSLLGACTAEERLWWEFFLKTGMREQEVMHVCWRDVNFAHETVRVSWKPEFNWTPKAYKEREVPVPSDLIAALREWKKQSPKDCPLVFPTAGCKPNTHFLRFLKACVKRAGLDESAFWLHKFRATFATWHLWNGADLRTVQKWLGHVDLESTMRYLKPARNKEMKAKVNTAFA